MASLDDLKIDPNDRLERRQRSRWPLVVFLLLAVGAIAVYFLRGARATPVELASVRVDASASGRSGSLLDASGYVTARRKATVSSKVTGKVMEVKVEEGMRVEEGQILARVDDSLLRRQLDLDLARQTTARTSLHELEVRLTLAQTNLRRTQELVNSQIVAQSQLDTDDAEMKAITAQLATARDNVAVAEREAGLTRQQIDDSVIRAPFAGIVVSKDAQPGEMISPVSAGGGFTRTGIGTIVDMGSLEIEVDVNETFINRVREGQKVEAVLDSYPEWRIPAHVITTVPTADREKATVKVRIAFEQLDPRILPDLGVKVSFLPDEPAAGSPRPASRLMIPKNALVEENGKQHVFVYAGGRVERRAVTVDKIDGNDAVITAGVAAGEQVVKSPPAGLADGARVEPAQAGKE